MILPLAARVYAGGHMTPSAPSPFIRYQQLKTKVREMTPQWVSGQITDAEMTAAWYELEQLKNECSGNVPQSTEEK